MTHFQVLFIIYTKDQKAASKFYSDLLGIQPHLDVPGMSEFQLSDATKLGIMPSAGIKQILENQIIEPDCSKDQIKCEMYLWVDDPVSYYQKAIDLGGIGISDLKMRNWGDRVAYIIDLDGNIIAFAESKSVIESKSIKLDAIKISQPAQRALKRIGCETLDDLIKYSSEELLALHGFGPKALSILEAVLQERGLDLKRDHGISI